ncbi:MAG: hypothetical protein CMF62_02010 [Magnetococcales bacterium]|nr:hypothetical protein [Magnetococcales bacterium]|tara:strand:+ start:135911 stop:136654 length:744 start_codon:yes stop_codon:yes gene_type:complete
MTFSVLSYNIWFETFKQIERTESLIETINYYDPDIICLQEVIEPILDILKERLINYKYIYPKKLIHRYGNVIFSKHKISKCMTFEFPNSKMGRSLELINLEIDKNTIIVATSHYESEFKKNEKNKEKINQYRLSKLILDKAYNKYKNIILASDTNLVKHEEDYFFSDKWKDSWIENNPSELGYTYDTLTNKNLESKGYSIKYRSRLDRIIYQADNLIPINSKLIKGTDGSIEPSDHHGILTSFRINF